MIIDVFLEQYRREGFIKPWIAYFVANDEGEIVDGGGFKGPPKHGEVEISYGTFKNFEGQGIGTIICSQLVWIAKKNRPITNHNG